MGDEMSRGAITEHLLQLIAKQVEDRGLVVWYDPERVYTKAAGELVLPNTTIARFTHSFFQLRHDIDHLLLVNMRERLARHVLLTDLTRRVRRHRGTGRSGVLL
jgi:hypothetical protein